MGRQGSRFASGAFAALLIALALAGTVQAVTYTNATLLIRWNGAGCLGSTTGTSLTAFADATQDAYDKLAYFPGTTTSTKCPDQTLSIAFTNLAKWESVGNIQYVFSARITDTSGTVSFYTPFNLKLTCSGTNYVHAGGVTCNDPGPNNYLQLSNALPPTPTITNLYQNFPNPQTSLYVAWGGVTPMPSDFDWWELHMSKTPGFTPSYSFPSTLLSKHTWGFQSRAVDNLEPGTQYCFRVRLADRYWEPDNFLTRPHPSFSQSTERCATTKALNLTVTDPDGGEIWSHNHTITWVQGNPSFTVELSGDAGGSWATLAGGVGTRSLAWNTANHPDGTQYLARVSDAASNDVSNATFWLDNTKPVTEASLDGPQCNGWYSEPPVLMLTATDNLAGVRTTSWRLSGGPVQAYTGPVAVSGDGNHTLAWWSDDRADIPNAEDAKSMALRIDTLPPVSVLSWGAPNWSAEREYVNSSTPLSILATDAGSGVNVTEYRVNGGPWLAYNGTFALQGPDGPYTVGVRSSDHACHLEDERTWDLFLDNTHPAVDIVSPASGSVTLEDQQLAAVPDLLDLLDVLLGQLPPELRSQVQALRDQAAALPPLPVGPQDLCEVARILGRELRAHELGEVADLLERLLCAPLPSSDVAVVAGNVTVRANATDPVVNGGASGMRRVDFFVDGLLRATDDTAPYEWLWDTTAEQPGPHALRAVAHDNLLQNTTDERTVLVAPSGPGSIDPLLGALPLPTLVQELLAFVRARLGL